MASFRRSRTPVRRRRMEWIGNPSVSFDSVSGGSATDFVLLNMEERSTGLGTMTDPTLIRIRGQVGIDPAFAANQSDSTNKNVVAGVILYVAEDQIPNVHNLQSTTETRFSSDNIIWTGLCGFSSEWNTSTGGASQVNTRVGQVWPHHIFEVDVKAQRKLGDRGKIRMSVCNFAGSGSNLIAGSLAFYYTLRFLLKE